MTETQGLAVARTQISVLQDLAALAGLSDQDADARVERACRRRGLLCGRCGGRRHYALNRGRYRCARCRYTFLLTTGRWLARLRVPSRKWLLLIKCFELGLNGKAAAFAGVSGPTFYRACATIRLSLADRDMRWKPGADDWAARGRAAPDVLGGRGSLDERGRSFFDLILDSLARHVRPPSSPVRGAVPDACPAPGALDPSRDGLESSTATGPRAPRRRAISVRITMA